VFSFQEHPQHVEVAQVVESPHDTLDCSISTGTEVKKGGDSSVVGGVVGGDVKQSRKRRYKEAFVVDDGMESLIQLIY
jgi:hypothetical protein